jgi:hypothetical protein
MTPTSPNPSNNALGEPMTMVEVELLEQYRANDPRFDPDCNLCWFNVLGDERYLAATTV